MQINLTRDFPHYDEDLETSIAQFTGLALACDCAVLGLEGAEETLAAVISKSADHLKEYRSIGSSPGGMKDERVNIEATLNRVESAMREILDYERLLDRIKDSRAGHGDLEGRDVARKTANEGLLRENDEKIKDILRTSVRPVIERVAKAWLPNMSLLAASYFMARAVLWRVSPGFMQKHHESLIEQSKALPAPHDRHGPYNNIQLWHPSIFLDLNPWRGRESTFGYRAPSVKYTRIVTGLDPWPEAPKPAEVIPLRSQAAPAPSSPMAKLSAAMKTIRDAVIPSGPQLGKTGPSGVVKSGEPQGGTPRRPGSR